MANNQLAVLSALDLAKTQWYHFTAIIIAGMGFFTDAYDLFCISTVTNLLGRIYYLDPKSNCPCTLPSPGTLPSPSPGTLPSPSTLPPHILAAVNGVALCGAIAGQLFIGWLGDKMGRRKVYGITLMIMVIAAIASGLSFGRTAKSVMTMLCFFRFWLGFGVGGDYPLSATIMSEYANKRTRGSFIAAVFAMQGFGILAGGAVAIIVSAGFKTKYKDDSRGCTAPQADFVWRIILMFGAIPAALTYYWRMKMPETARYTALIARDANQAAADMSSVLNLEINEDQRRVEEIARTEPRFGLFSREFARRHGLRLLGTTSTWFLIDIVFYSQNLFFQKNIFTKLGWINQKAAKKINPQAKYMNAIEEVYQIAKAQSIVALCSTVPGYWFTVAFIERMGRKPIQLMGFFFTALFLIAFAITYDEGVEPTKPTALIVLYCFTFFFSNFGPNVTTIIVPAEIFPARLRSTCHGISGAAGKAGAIIGAVGFIYGADTKGIGLRNSLILLAVTSATGFLFTFLIPETMGKSLEELSGENDEEQVVQLGPSRLSSRGSSRSTMPIE